MSRCAYCRCELAGFEMVCQPCLESRYDHLVHPKPWWNGLRLRLTRGNLFAFCFLFVFSFVLLRFDFPYFRGRDMGTTPASAGISILIASFAFLHREKDRPAPVTLAAVRLDSRPAWSALALSGILELAVAAVLYAVFTYAPLTLGIIVISLAWIVIQIDIFDPLRTGSFLSRLTVITEVLMAVCFVAWRITHQDTWLRFTLVGSALVGGLVFLDRWQDSK
ncbi:MAG TPA: hypothetical protein VF753_04755 [Terriglobales bacterium]